MEANNYYLEEGFPLPERKLEKMKSFLAKSGLTYDEQIQYSVILRTLQGEIAGCGSRHENTLKCIAIDETWQGEGFLQAIVTQLIKNAYENQISHLFLFTKPQYRMVFSDMGFYPIMDTEDMLLMENRKNGIREYLQKEAAPFSSDSQLSVGAIVMNANPFTNGHLHLVKTAAASCDRLHIFVLSTDASEFPAAVRLRLVQEGCRNLPNVFVHGSSDYLISHATFPDYFLKDKAAASDKAAVLDLKIFGTYYKEAFHITRRFVGEEPFSRITALYNQQMKKILPSHGIEITEIPRLEAEDTIISATYVRRQFIEGNTELLKNFVPPSTFEYLCSRKGENLQKQLSHSQA